MGGLLWATLATRAADLMSGGLRLDVVSRSAQQAQQAQQANTPANETSQVIDQLQFSAAKSIRTSIITLASFNVLAAAVTLACVLWDCYSGARRKNPAITLRDVRPTLVGAPQVFPLVLCLGIIIQGIMFAVAQSKGLEALLVEGCTQVSQMMMPATFLVPFIQLIFGVETTLRAFPRDPFPARRKWVVPACLAVIIAGLIALYAVTLSLRPPDVCFASLFWFTQQWRPVCFGLLVGIATVLFLCLVAVFFRLRHSAAIFSMERTAASHMVYYIAVAVISNALLTPFFFSITFGGENDSATHPMELSTVSSIVANLSGLVMGGLYLFLRGRIRSRSGSYHRDTFDFDGKYFDKVGDKRTSSYPGFPGKNQRPSSPSLYSQSDYGDHHFHPKTDEEKPQGLDRASVFKKGFSMEMNNLASMMRLPTSNGPIEESSGRNATAHSRRSSSSFFAQFPPGNQTASPSLLPPTTYTPASARLPSASKPEAMLMPPPLFHAPKPSFHNRNSSVGSAQTVQIGLRISNMNDVRPPRRSSQLPSPRQTQGVRSQTPAPAAASNMAEPATNTSGHTKQSSNGTIELNKRLPQVPPESAKQGNEEEGEIIQLSPTVYEPQKQPPRAKLASPKGVGFQTAPVDRTQRRGPQASAAANPATDKGGWI